MKRHVQEVYAAVYRLRAERKERFDRGRPRRRSSEDQPSLDRLADVGEGRGHAAGRGFDVVAR
jgi:hypothetical protein